MTMDGFQIDGIRQDVTESLKSAERYSIPLDQRCLNFILICSSLYPVPLLSNYAIIIYVTI